MRKLYNLREYHRPTDLDEAKRLLHRKGIRSAPLAGGVGLIGEATPDVEAVVDLDGLQLDFIEHENGVLDLGAMVRLQTILEKLADISDALLTDAARRTAGWNVRNSATVGGVLASGDSHSPLSVALAALNARVKIYGQAGEMPLWADLSKEIRRQGLKGKLITAISLNLPDSPMGASYEQVARTPADRAIVCAASVAYELDGGIQTTTAVGGLLPDILVFNHKLAGVDSNEAEESLAAEIEKPRSSASAYLSDYRGTAEYRRAIAPILAKRALKNAVTRATPFLRSCPLMLTKPHAANQNQPFRFLLWTSLALLIGFALRVYQLGVKDIWVDEALVWYYAKLPLIESVVLGFTGGPINSNADPLYNVLLHGWLPFAGESVFALRFFSVAANLLTVAYLSRVAARMFGSHAGALAVALGVIAPLWVFYSQEMRPYAFTPALMLLMVEAAYDLEFGKRDSNVGVWAQLVIGEVLALYVHGFMLFGVIGINLWLGWFWLRRLLKGGSLVWFRDWALSQLAALILILPSLPTYLGRVGGFRNPFVPRLTFAQFANEMWSFFMGIPREHALDPLLLRLPVALIAILAVVGLAIALRAGRSRFLADLVWLTMAIMGLTLSYAQNDPSVHPRYVVFMTGPVLLILASVLDSVGVRGRAGQWLGVGLAFCLIAVSIMSIDNLYVGRYRGYRHPATRAVTDTLKASFDSTDGIVVVNAHDFTLSYYGTGNAPLIWARYDDGIETAESLPAFIQGKQRIGLLRDTNERSDTRRIAPFYLERFGTLLEKRYFEGYDLSIYQIDQTANPEFVAFAPIDLNWGSLTLRGHSIESSDAVTVSLHWALTTPLPTRARVAAAIRLVDPVTGWEISGADALLLDVRGNPTESWPVGGETDQYFVLPLQPGTPPIKADLLVSLYDTETGQALDLHDSAGAPAGQQAYLGEVTLGRAPEQWAYDDNQRLWQLQSIESDVLSGYVADKSLIAPGGALGVTLAWTMPAGDFPKHEIAIQLVQEDVIVAEDRGPALQGRKIADTLPGQSWLDRRLLSVAGSARPGSATLRVMVDEKLVTLTNLEVVGYERVMQRPSIEYPFEAVFDGGIKLLGYKLETEPRLTSISVVKLILYWQAVTDGLPEANYKVTTQMLAADGHLVGQYDGIPANETRPFSGWLAGEYVTDLRPMTFSESYVGPIAIQVALYNPVTFERVLTDSGADAISLPAQLAVESIP